MLGGDDDEEAYAAAPSGPVAVRTKASCTCSPPIGPVAQIAPAKVPNLLSVMRPQ